MLRHGRPRDRQLGRQLSDSHRCLRQPRDDRAPRAISQNAPAAIVSVSIH
jgi:hypothetical protein